MRPCEVHEVMGDGAGIKVTGQMRFTCGIEKMREVVDERSVVLERAKDAALKRGEVMFRRVEKLPMVDEREV